MRKFLAILLIASSSASGMIGISSVPTEIHKQNSCNKALDNRKVISLKCDNVKKIFFFDSDTKLSETSDIFGSDNNVFDEGNTFGIKQNDINVVDMNDIEQDDILPANSDDEEEIKNGRKAFSVDNITIEREQNTESDIVSDYEEYCSDMSNDEEILYIEDFDENNTLNGESTSKDDLKNRKSIQWYFNKNYGARSKPTVQQYMVLGHPMSKIKLSEDEVRESLKHIHFLNKNGECKQCVHFSDCSSIFDMSGIGEKSSSQSLDQYFGGETSSELK